MFKVRNKKDYSIYTVYDIVYDKTGFPHFLLYIEGQWKRESAKHYEIFESEDTLCL